MQNRTSAWLLALGMCNAQLGGQVITTIAGTAKAFPASGLQALNAQVGVTDVAVDSLGNVYIADAQDNIVAKVSPNGTLTVVAGNGKAGFSGDGGPATNASLNVPMGVAVDSSGNLYIADEFNDRIRKVSSNGVITTIAGGAFGSLGDGGPATSASLSIPEAVAVDLAGSVYIADTGNYRIRKVSGGTITTIAGNGTYGFSGDGASATAAQLSFPQGVAVDSAGNVFIADTDNERIRKVSNGMITTVAGSANYPPLGDGGPPTSAGLSIPEGVAVDSAGNIYIADTGDVRIRKVSGGTITTVAGNGTGGFSGDGGPAANASLGISSEAEGPSAVAVDSVGDLYIADSYNNRVRNVIGGIINTIAGNGLFSFSGDGAAATSALLDSATGIAMDSAGGLYIADGGNQRIRKVSGGTIATLAGNGKTGFSGDGGPALSASLNFPGAIAFDAAGNLYFADISNFRVRKITGGMVTTVAGNGSFGFSGDGGPATQASLEAPGGIAIDSSGNLYIADTGNHRIRKVAGGIITTVAGNGTGGFSGDGGPATSAALYFPANVAVDSSGNLYIADSANGRVRKVTGGTITTLVSSPLYWPVGLAIDALGELYIADEIINQVLRVANGALSIVAGSGTKGFSGDGGLATKAALHLSEGLLTGNSGLALDPNGDVYIADSGNNRIREVFAGSVSYLATPSTLSFSSIAGGTAPGSQSINLSSSVAGLPFTASTTAPWLTVTPSTGTIPSVLQVTVDPSTLTAGNYSATITITVPNATPSTSTVAVTLTVTASTPAALGLSTQTVSFTATQGTTQLTQQLQILNTGGGSLPFTAATSGASWLTISTTTGTATQSSPASLTITATPGSLAPGTYSGTVAIVGAGTTINVPVTLSVSAPTAVILISQVGLTFTAVAQGGVPLPQTFGILNTGQGSMSWSATSSTIAGGNWLAISPSTGTVATPYLDVSLVTVTINPAGLSAGTYYGQIQVSATAANTPQLVTIILNVLPAGLSLGPQLYPTGLIFTGVSGVTPGSQDVQVGNPTGTVNSFQSGQIGTGFSFLPTNATIQPNQPTDVRVYPDFTQLTPGSITKGTITLQFSDQSPSQTINVLFVVAPPGATANRVDGKYHIDLSSAASGCASQNLQVQYRSPALNFAAVQGQATPLEVQVTDGCGTLVGPGGGQPATVTANFSTGEPAQTMTHIGNGIWQVGWKPVKTGLVVVTVLALLPQSVGVIGGQASLSGTVSSPSTSATPLVTAAGVVHSASDQSGVPISPGGLITVYGNNLADGTAQDNGLPLPQTLSGTQVLLGTQPLPILYTNTGQLNVQVPYGVPINTQYQLTVQHGSTLSLPQSLVVAPAQPGIFTVNQQGTGQGSIVKSDGVTLVQPGTPATAGDTIVIYCTGLGAVTPAVKEGSPAPSTPPLSTTVNPVTVTIGGLPAVVAFSGLTPGFAGLYQINVVVPSGITPGNAVPVVLTVAGQTSPPVTIAIK